MSEDLNQTVGSEIQGTDIRAAQSYGQIMSDHDTMLKEIRSWGLWSLGLGALHIISSGFFSAPWGILLLIVGAASYFFQTSSMFVIYAVTLSWAALSNLRGGQPAWIVFALFQVFLVIRVFQQYRRFRASESEYLKLTANDINAVAPAAGRAARSFPLIGSIISCSSLLGLIALFLGILIIAIVTESASNIPGYLGFVEGLIVNFGVLGFAVGLASLLSKYSPKFLGILGLVSGALTLMIEFALVYL